MTETIRLKFDVKGLAKARRDLQRMRERSQDLRPAWDVVLTWWAARNATNFRNKGKRWKTPWAALAEATVADRVRAGYPPHDTLIREGRLRDSLIKRPLGIERLRPHELTAGTAVPYAVFHQRGTKKMPARPLINARQVSAEGVTSTAVINWIVEGRRSTRSSKIERTA